MHRPREQMAVVYLVVAVRADEQQVLDARTTQEPVQQVERRGVHPLQVVQKHDQRMFPPGEGADETLEDIPEPIARLGGIERRRGRLFTDNQLDLRDHVCQHAAVRAQRSRQASAPLRKALFALSQQLPDQAAEGLRERTVRNVPDDLIELAGDEVPPLPDDRFIQLVNQRRLADSGIARHEHQGGTALTCLFERTEQVGHFTVPAVQFLRNQESIGHVLLREIEYRDRPIRGPLAQASVDVVLEAERTLIAILGGLRQQVPDDPGQLLRYRVIDLRRRRRGPGNVRVNQ